MDDLVTVVLARTETSTPGAIMFHDEDDIAVWLPRKLIKSMTCDESGLCNVVIPDWLADEKLLQPIP